MIKFYDSTNLNVKYVIDPIHKGNVGKDPFALNGKNKRNSIINRLSKVNLKSVDTMIIGYINELKR